MRRYQYRATDAQGRPVTGTISARTASEARTQLTARGLAVQALQEVVAGAPSVGSVTPGPGPATPTPHAVRQNPNPLPQIQLGGAPPPAWSPAPSPAPNVPAAPRPAPAPGAVRPAQPQPTAQNPSPAGPAPERTRPGTDGQRFFLFTQVAAALKAGMNPAQAFDEISNRVPAHFQGPMREVSAAASRGESLADAMARYPDLFPADVVGTMRAGQEGGFLPEATDEVARHAEVNVKFRRWFFWVKFVVINLLLVVLLSLIATRAFLVAYERIDTQGGQLNFSAALGIVMRSFVAPLIWPYGPLILFGLATWLAIWRYLLAPASLRFRHEVALRAPIFGARARHESLSRFSWTMARLAKAGFSPARTWQLASESVPNLAMRDILTEVGRQLHGHEKMSDLLFRTRVFPETYAPVVATAEYTGDLPGAMDHLARASYSDYELAVNYAKARSGCWGMLGCFVASAVSLGIVMYFWWVELPAKVLKGFEP